MSTTPDTIAAPKVITIHGVCPSSWQETARRVLAPHFAYSAIRYSDYNCSRGGAIKAVVHPLLLLTAIAVAFWAAYAGASRWWYAATLGLVGAGARVACVQRQKCAERLKTRISDESADAYATHVIAHSFGTYVAARAMASYDIMFDRVVLVGCVLPRRFDWQAVFDRRPLSGDLGWLSSVLDIRNETGTSDRVVWLAGLTAWLTRELGSAGRKGFLAGRHQVHAIASPWQTCGTCPNPDAAVHNVALDAYGHSTWALGVGHALHIWLPYLWGYDASRFRDWLNVCSRATRELQAGNEERFSDAVVLLLRSEWPWTSRPDGTERTLEACIADKTGGGAVAAATLHEVMRRLVHAVHLAQSAAVTSTPSSDKIRWRLDPRLAIDYTIADVLTSAP